MVEGEVESEVEGEVEGEVAVVHWSARSTGHAKEQQNKSMPPCSVPLRTWAARTSRRIKSATLVVSGGGCI